MTEPRRLPEILSYIQKRVLQHDAHFYQLLPIQAKKIPYHMMEDATFAKESALPWLDVTPLDFLLVEPDGESAEYLTIQIRQGQFTIDSDDLDDLFKGYVHVYFPLLESTKDPAIATQLAALSWLQHYHIKHSVFIPEEGTSRWLTCSKSAYRTKGLTRPILNEALLTLYPDAGHVFTNIRNLDITSLDASDSIEATCVYRTLAALRNNHNVDVSLPNNFES